MTQTALIYSGPSQLDGKPIVAFMTFGSRNEKTGDTAQLWIMSATSEPHEAVKNGDDATVCGDCIHRPLLAKSNGVKPCYVKTWQAPLSIFRAWKRGSIDLVSPCTITPALRGYKLRLGAYGDPAALPRDLIETLCADTLGVLGYTHQWKDARFAWLAQYCMASVDRASDLLLARALGFRSFYVRDKGELNLVPDNAVKQCPAAKEAGQKVTCSQCMACGGLSSLAVNDRAINQH